MIRKILWSVITCVVLFSVSVQTEARAAGFLDVKNYKDEIEFLASKGIINGYEGGYFKPRDHVTRLQAVTMILREKGITDFDAADPGFTDLKKGNYGYDKVSKAVELGIISGKTHSNGTSYFDATAPLTRGQMAKILVLGYNLPKTTDVTFKDVPENNGFKEYICVLATENITTGYLDNTFRPNNKLSREHFAAFMARLVDESFKPALLSPTTPVENEKLQNTTVAEIEQAVIDLTNAERLKEGLNPLQFDATLQKTAKQKSEDMAKNLYFSHTSPTYGSPYDQMKSSGITYFIAGENIAKGYESAQEVLAGWINSEGHRKNILNEAFTHIGVGYVENGDYWTQQFIGK